jgi:hypothetical protein
MTVCLNDNIDRIYNSRIQQSAPKKVEKNDCVGVHSTEDKFSQNQREGIRICSALGVAVSLALLAKFDKKRNYSLNPKKILNSKLKNTYIFGSEYKSKQIISMGAGSCVGGLIGGAIFDKKENFNAKVRESVVQMTNVSLPIVFVEALSTAGKYCEKFMPNWSKSSNILKKSVTKLPSVTGAMVGLGAGMYVGNRVSNKVNEHIFKKKDVRPIKLTDFSAHIDDICVAATFISENNPLTRAVSRFIPLALCVPGNEVGSKQED